MPAAKEETVHASAVLAGERAVLIRGASGSGKSRLVLNLLSAANIKTLPFTRLVSDDRVRLFAAHGRLVASAPQPISGLIEARGLGIRQTPYEPTAVIGLVVDLSSGDANRMPEANAQITEILGIKIPRLAVAVEQDPFPLLLAALTTKQKV